MNIFNVDFSIEPSGRDVSLEVEAASSKYAMIEALTMLELEPGEILHSLHAHIGRPLPITSG